jgi:hypothetical protein
MKLRPKDLNIIEMPLASVFLHALFGLLIVSHGEFL